VKETATVPIPTHAEYAAEASEFRVYLQEQAVRARDDQEWPDSTDEWMKVPATVICRTPGCPASGTPYQIDLHEHADGSYGSKCWPCGELHRDRWLAFADEAVNVGAPPAPAPHTADPEQGGEAAAPDEGGLSVGPARD
jgi:hypothetical protein